jgi:hypothetical protein
VWDGQETSARLHADPSITARIYSHVVRPDRQVAELLDQLIADTSSPAAVDMTP